jgi:hypothetical protein
MPVVTALGTQVLLSGGTLSGPIIVPSISWNCNYSAYGSINQFHVRTSIKALKDMNYNIFQQFDQNPLTYQIQIFVTMNNVSTLIFNGLVDAVDASWHDDTVEITGRDLGAILRDTTATLDQDQYLNQFIGQIVTQIASNNGFGTSKIDPSKQYAGVRYTPAGGTEWAFTDRARPIWSVLHLLAKETGYLLFVDQQKNLVFGNPGEFSTNPQWQYYWRPGQKRPNTNVLPILQLEATQQSRRCKDFKVQVYSYDRSSKLRTSAVSIDGDGTGQNYNMNIPGMSTPQVCQQTADAIKAEIERKKNTFKFTVDGNPQIQIGDLISVQEYEPGDLLGLSNQQCFVSGLSHSYQMASHESATAEGFLTHITAALNIQSKGGTGDVGGSEGD